jgi:RinA family phage transcriptional activator
VINIYTDTQLDAILTNYRNLNRLLLNKRAAVMHPWRETDTNIGGGSSGRLSHPTETAAIKMAEDDEGYIRLRKVIRAIKLLIENTNDSEKGKIMQAYYFDGRRPDDLSSSTMTNYRRWFRSEFRKKLEEVEKNSEL